MSMPSWLQSDVTFHKAGLGAEELSDGFAVQGNRDVVVDGSHYHLDPFVMLDGLFD